MLEFIFLKNPTGTHFMKAYQTATVAAPATADTKDQKVNDTKLEAKFDTTLRGHSSAVLALTLLPDRRLASGSCDYTIKLWDIKAGEHWTLKGQHSNIVSAFTLLSDGRFASGSYDKTIKLWSLKTYRCVQTLSGHTDAIRALTLSSDGWVASGSDDMTIKLWDVKTGKCLQTLSGHSHNVNGLTMLSDRWLASGSEDKTIKLWDVKSGECVQTLSGHSHNVYALTMLSDGRLASGSYDQTIKLWDVKTGVCAQTLSGHSHWVNALTMLSDGQLASGSYDKTIKLWDVKTGACAQTLSGHSDGIYALTQLSDGHLASSGDTDGSIKLWKLGESTLQLQGAAKLKVEEEVNLKAEQEAKADRQAKEKAVKEKLAADSKDHKCTATADTKLKAKLDTTLSGHSNNIFALTLLSDGRLASGSWDKTIKLWDIKTGLCAQTLSEHSYYVSALTLLSDGRLASGSWDKTIKLWDVERGECVQTLSGHSKGVIALTLLSDGRLASGSWDKTIKLWDVKRGECVQTLSGHSDGVAALTQLLDGRLASGSRDHTIKLWDIKTGACAQTLSKHSHAVTALTQLSDDRLASGSEDNTITLWSVKTGMCEQTLIGHSNGVYALRSLSDNRLASGSGDSTIKLWDVKTGVCAQTLSGHAYHVYALTQLSDGRLASGSMDKTIKLWDVGADVLQLQAGKKLIADKEKPPGLSSLLPSPTNLAQAKLQPTVKLLVNPISSTPIDPKKDSKQATFTEQLQYANQGSAPSQQYVGWCYSKGEGVEQDSAKAVSWYHKAATQGHVDAQTNLAWHYESGQGIGISLEDALAWYKKAAAQNNAWAQEQVERLSKQLAEPIKQNAINTTAPTKTKPGDQKAPALMPISTVSSTAAVTTVSVSAASVMPAKSDIKTNLAMASVTQIAWKDLLASPLTLIGNGSYGDVYLGQWLGTDVAIKQLQLKTLPETLAKHFEQEVLVMQQCQFPNIVRLYGVCTEPGHYAMVMEYLPQKSLRHRLQDEKEFLWRQRWQIAVDMAQGLAYLHSRKILHRDLKSLNILLDANHHAKISDFGLAKVKLEINSSSSTKNNKASGSVRWRAPELFKRSAVATPMTDVYSLGMILWEIVTRQLPFNDAADEVTVMGWIKDGEQEKIPENCPPALAEIIQACWAAPEKRPTAQDIVMRLKQAQTEEQAKDAKQSAREKIWQFDSSIKPAANTVKDYALISAAGNDIKKVNDYYQRAPVAGYEIKSVQVIYNPNFNRSFSLAIETLQARHNNPAFAPKWVTENDSAWRKATNDQLEQAVMPYQDNDYPGVKLVPVWHGTRPEVLSSLFKAGYANLATTDSGYFGKGLYSAFEADYSYRIYCKGALLINWVAFYSAYPTIHGDRSKLAGKGNYSNYDAHFIPVVSEFPNDTDCASYIPCKPNQKHTYRELVVFESTHCLPRYLVELQPALPKAIALKSAGDQKDMKSQAAKLAAFGSKAIHHAPVANANQVAASGTAAAPVFVKK